MGQTKGITRKACIAIAILGIAFAAVPSASAICLGDEPIWWPRGCATVAAPLLWDDWYVCVSTDPFNDGCL